MHTLTIQLLCWLQMLMELYLVDAKTPQHFLDLLAFFIL